MAGGIEAACEKVSADGRVRGQFEWEGWDDAAVAPEKLGSYLRGIRKLLDETNQDLANVLLVWSFGIEQYRGYCNVLAIFQLPNKAAHGCRLSGTHVATQYQRVRFLLDAALEVGVLHNRSTKI